MGKLRTKLYREDGKFYEKSTQDVSKVKDRINDLKEMGADKETGSKVACSIPTALFHKLSNELGFTLFELSQGSQEERQDKLNKLMALIRKDYPHLIVHE